MKFLRVAISISLLNFVFIALAVYSASSISALRKVTQTEKEISVLQDINLSSPTPTNTPRITTVNVAKTTTKAPTRTASPTIKTPSPTPPSTPVVNRCVIIIDGSKYDVTDFRSIHKGGDIFKCSTDMTQVFYSQHDKPFLSKIESMRVP